MMIPALFLGTATEVRSRMRKLVARVARGEPLLEALDGPLIDTSDVPEALIWTNSIRPMRAAEAGDFRIVLLSSALQSERKLDVDRLIAIRADAASSLEQTAWGTVLLNSQQGWWLGPFVRPPRVCVLAVLRGTVRHWDELSALGRRFCSGQEARFFASILVSAFPSALELVGAPVRSRSLPASGLWTSEKVWDDPRPLVKSLSLIEHIERDDAFWAAAVRTRGGPPTELGNEAEIAALCRQGSWERRHWEFLKASSGGAAAVESALKALRERGEWNKLLGALIHGVGDIARATQLFAEHSNDSDLHWARKRIANHLRDSDPLQAASLLIADAEQSLSVGKARVYRQSVETLAEAREILVASGHESKWTEQLQAFKARHARRKALLTALTKKSL